MRKIILFINPVSATCGVYQHGKLVAQLLKDSKKYSVIYKECDSINQLVEFYNSTHPDIIVYNYHPALLGFLVQNYGAIRSLYNVQHVGLITDGTQEVLMNPTIHNNLIPGGTIGTAFCPQIFDRYLFMDPETIETNYIKKVLPTIPLYKETKESTNNKVMIGSFGFGGPDKGFDKLVQKVESEFDEAIIRVHIPFATYGDADGTNAKTRIDECRAMITKPGIELVATHDFVPESEILDYLHDCNVNIFVYNDVAAAQGIASTPHFGIAVNKPFLVSKTSKTRHLTGISDLVDMNKTTIKEAITMGADLVKPFRDEWSRTKSLQSYEKVFNELIDLKHFFGAMNPALDNVIADAFPDDGYKGVCIDIGAGDGKLGSNTMYFERNGWDCLCIEPNPIYESYLRSCRERVVVAAITNNTESDIMPLKVFKVGTVGVHDGDPPHQFGALTALEVDEQLYTRFKSQGSILEEYEVPTKVMTLTKCIEENNFPTNIDFISIDTEGTELDILKSIDFSKIFVTLFVVENNFGTTEIEDYLKPFGYSKYLSYEGNDFIIHNSKIA